MQGGASAPRLKPAIGRINVKVYERLERNGTTAKWDRDAQKWEVKKKRDSGLECCIRTLDSRLDMKGGGAN